jgi:hypothetical protein
MKRERNFKPQRKMKPVFLVFCEGETEETYINFLRKEYKLPVKVITHVTGLAISPGIIKRYIRAEQIGPNDKITSFLMYDLDIKSSAEKIAVCKDSVSIASNPSVELWFLLHNGEQNSAISTDACIEKLKKASPDWVHYQKGSLSEKQKQLLWDNRRLASARAKRLPEGENPSSLVFRLIEAMDSTVAFAGKVTQ